MTNPTPSKGKKTIMVADDSQGILDVMRMMLEDAGYAVRATTDGRDVRNLKGPLPDLLFLDILLSGTDGGELCTHLKSNDQTKHLPIIILSANRDIEEIAGVCGADGFLAKPFEMGKLLSQVRKYTS